MGSPGTPAMGPGTVEVAIWRWMSCLEPNSSYRQLVRRLLSDYILPHRSSHTKDWNVSHKRAGFESWWSLEDGFLLCHDASLDVFLAFGPLFVFVFFHFFLSFFMT